MVNQDKIKEIIQSLNVLYFKSIKSNVELLSFIINRVNSSTDKESSLYNIENSLILANLMKDAINGVLHNLFN